MDGAATESPIKGPPSLDGAAREELPLGGYSTLTGVFGVAFAGSMALAVRRRGELPPQPSPWDVATIGVATHKLTRLIAKAKVTSFLRAPFTEYEGRSGRAEVSESPQGRGCAAPSASCWSARTASASGWRAALGSASSRRPG